jgi:hypothetical protein
MPYAQGTDVPVERSRAELERLLTGRGGRNLVVGVHDDAGVLMVQCDVQGRRLRLVLPVPTPEQYRHDRAGRQRTAAATAKAVEAEMRRRWRALLLVVKGRFEAIDTGIEDFDTAWMPYLVLPETGETVGQYLRPQIDAAYTHGRLPSPLPGAPLALPAGATGLH